MTPLVDPRSVRLLGSELPTTSSPPRDLATWNRVLNRTHAMAQLRARGGWIVRAIEARRRAIVARHVLRTRPRVVVDVGCEDGWVAAAWRHAVREVVLVDVDPEGLDAACGRLGSGARPVVADATDARSLARGLGGVRADVIVLSALLEHLPDPGATLDGLSAYLAPGGRFVLYVPADGPILALKRVLGATRTCRLVRGLSLDPAPGHLWRFDRASLRRLLAVRGRLVTLSFDPAVLGYVAELVPSTHAGSGDP